MKNVKIKFLDAGIGNDFQYKLEAIDKCGNIYFSGTSYNGEVCFKVKPKSCLTLKVCSFRGIMIKTIYVGYSDTYISLYYENKKNSTISLVTFILTDENYENLPIMEGELYL